MQALECDANARPGTQELVNIEWHLRELMSRLRDGLRALRTAHPNEAPKTSDYGHIFDCT